MRVDRPRVRDRKNKREVGLKAHLPKPQHWAARQRLHLIRDAATYAEAEKQLASMTSWLGKINLSDRESLLGAGEDLLTMHRLGVRAELRPAVRTTDTIMAAASWGVQCRVQRPHAAVACVGRVR